MRDAQRTRTLDARLLARGRRSVTMELFRDLIFHQHFLGWDRPLPITATEWLVERNRNGQTLDLSDRLCVLPTSQTAVRLGELLARRSDELSLEYRKPSIITAGELPERLYSIDKPLAIEFEQTLAWARVLQKQSDEQLRPLMPTMPESDSLAPWLEVAGTLRRLSTDLASHNVSFENVLDIVQTADDRQRWELLKRLYNEYISELSRAGLVDPYEQRRLAVKNQRVGFRQPIYLIGTSDLNESIAAMVKEVDGEVTALIAAPKERQNSFDHLGRLKTEAFLKDELPLRDEQLISSGDISDQAIAVGQWVCRLGETYSPSQITIGLTDPSQIAPVEAELEDCDRPAYRHAGWTISQTAPGRLIQRLTRLISRPTWESLASFARHTDSHAWLTSQLESSGDPSQDKDILCDLDKLLAEHFPLELSDTLPIAALKNQPVAVGIRRHVCDWLAPFLPSDYLPDHRKESSSKQASKKRATTTDQRPISEWSLVLRDWLATVYDEGPSTSLSGNRDLTIQAIDKINELLERFSELNGRLDVKVSAAMALETINSRLSELRVGTEMQSDSDVESSHLHGWLDLALDDSPAMVVVGFNHPFVPGAVTSDPFLPGALRSELRMADNDRRYARDVYAMQLMLRTRKEIYFIVGSNAADGSPTPPSRLLSAAPQEAIARRVRNLLHHKAPASSIVIGKSAPLEATRLPIPVIEDTECPIDSMSVTAFKSYLECPFRFYLRHVLGLKPVDDAAGELAANQFGDLVHGALENFGLSEDRNETSSKRIYDAFTHHLNAYANQRYGQKVRSSVQMQIRQAQRRLKFVADQQAERIDQGWQIHATEASVSPKMGAAIEVDGKKMGLKGRFDRIDYHPEDNRWAILDYKTHGSPPEKKHLRRSKDEGKDNWIDLQLPLYREMIPYLGIEVPRDEVQLGYFNVSDKEEETKINLANFSPAQLDSATELIRDCIRNIFACRFEPSEEMVMYDDYETIMQTGVPTRMLSSIGSGDEEVGE
ncbi:PD-(D/E)XK nuclease family protein [Rhodopirellula baltica]|nr:PD-(D/E)XK nuclease family protein [Rhodopirellula baltica]